MPHGGLLRAMQNEAHHRPAGSQRPLRWPATDRDTCDFLTDRRHLNGTWRLDRFDEP